MPKGKYLWTEEHRNIVKELHKSKKIGMYGRKQSEKFKQAMKKLHSDPNWKPRLGRKNSEDHKQKLRAGAIRWIKEYPRAREYYQRINLIGIKKQQDSKEPTSIEKKVYDYLLFKGILFEKQKLINGKFLVDAYIPSLNLVIEADGDYWHSMDKIKKRDKSKTAYLTKCGFNLLRLTEAEINNGKFKERMVL